MRGKKGRGPALVAAFCSLSSAAAADVNPCSLSASISPCFDADPVWIAPGRSPFVTFASPRSSGTGALDLVASAGVARRPVIVAAPSPHPEGREVPVLDVTSTVTLGSRYGAGRGMDLALALPLVPYQSGTGAEGVTSQRTPGVRTTTLRDPRVSFLAELAAQGADAPVTLGTRLELALPLGEAGAFAGAAGPTVAPAFAAELEKDRWSFALDLGLRLRRAASFGTVRKGSEAVVAAAAGFTALSHPWLTFTLEASLRPTLVGPPPGTPGGARDLPAEWLAGASLRTSKGAPWSFAAAFGSGLPLSRTGSPSAAGAVLGVTAPAFRTLALVRYEAN
jgi:hypothetical protein